MAGLEDLPASGLSPGAPALPRRFFARPALEVAREVLGCVVEHHGPDGLVAVRLTEVEAYGGPGDPGSHARNGRTPRTTPMFGPPGHLYVYFSYGMHWCANLVCSPEGQASAVLLRAGEVVEGLEVARARRATSRGDADLARGPARLTAALGLGRDHDGDDVCADGPVVVRRGPVAAAVRTGPRTGVSGAGGDAGAYPWRFWLDGEPSVSPYRPAAARSSARRPIGQAVPRGGPGRVPPVPGGGTT